MDALDREQILKLLAESRKAGMRRCAAQLGTPIFGDLRFGIPFFGGGPADLADMWSVLGGQAARASRNYLRIDDPNAKIFRPWQLSTTTCLTAASGAVTGPYRRKERPFMLPIIAVLLLVALLFGLGFAVNLLWWIAAIVLIVWVLGFFLRGPERTGRWYRARLRRSFREIGAGFWLNHAAPFTMWELETTGR